MDQMSHIIKNKRGTKHDTAQLIENNQDDVI